MAEAPEAKSADADADDTEEDSDAIAAEKAKAKLVKGRETPTAVQPTRKSDRPRKKKPR